MDVLLAHERSTIQDHKRESMFLNHSLRDDVSQAARGKELRGIGHGFLEFCRFL